MGKELSRKELRNKYWFANLILSKITKIHSRDKLLWIFSAWEGNQYEDNSRYLFEYVNKNHKEINAIWMSDNETVINKVQYVVFLYTLFYFYLIINSCCSGSGFQPGGSFFRG